jgi:1-aminocyclopropane-1-carboxylate deaminase/D-cysteine desulfhydrase-like pyridoxal-dependent ACC family enzyme/DNA modification methylase
MADKTPKPKAKQHVDGVLMTSDSGNDPRYYAKKQAVERAIGRKLTTEEFQRDYYTGPDSYESGTSIFDPVLCELVYRWFTPVGGSVLDPFAGGSVRGIVAAKLGRHYTGIELRPEQIAANREQAKRIIAPLAAGKKPAAAPADELVRDVNALTPVQRRGNMWFKRDDLVAVGNVRGGKVRTCWHLAQGAPGLVTAGSRQSPQVNIVAAVADALGLPVSVHTPSGDLSPEVQAARAKGATVTQHKAGYNNVIIARAREDAQQRGWREIPFGMECEEAITQTRRQVANFPKKAKRLVMPVGSGMSLAGVLWGLRDIGRTDVRVVGVRVGGDPAERLQQYAPAGWQDQCELVTSALDYHAPAPDTAIEGIPLDPIYEAKCLPYLQPDDVFWLVGIRETAVPRPPVDEAMPTWIEGDSTDAPLLAPGNYDLLFSCPPYADLEVYSDDPRDLSTMKYEEFLAAYRRIIAQCVGLLKPNAFACFVVGDVRDKKGFYRNFTGDTVRAFLDAGMQLYNEAILVTQVGSLSIRVGKQFNLARKLGKTHQNVYVFYKGDAMAIRQFGDVEFGELPAAADDAAADAAPAAAAAPAEG